MLGSALYDVRGSAVPGPSTWDFSVLPSPLPSLEIPVDPNQRHLCFVPKGINIMGVTILKQNIIIVTFIVLTEWFTELTQSRDARQKKNDFNSDP